MLITSAPLWILAATVYTTSNVSTKEAPASAPAETPSEAPQPPNASIPRKTWYWIGGITIAVWAFTLNTGSRVLMIVVGALTLLLIGMILWALRTIRKHRNTMSLLQSGVASPEARREALAKLAESKDAKSPTNVLARAQLLSQEEPKEALALLDTIELKSYPPAMQDDVSLLRVQIYLRLGRPADARKSADLMNLDNPQRKEVKAVASVLVAEAWSRTGKPKEALALLDAIELPKKDADQLALQARFVRVFARFASNQRNQARQELVALADEDPNYLGRFVMPEFRVHPELQKLARSVLEQHPAARRQIKSQTRRR